MGDPHHNTWGGKNNSWGNRSRKQKQSPQYRENKPFRVLATIAIGAVLIAGIVNTIQSKSIIDTVKNVDDTVEGVKEIRDTVKNDSSDAKVSNNTGIEIDTDDIKELLEKIDESTSEKDIKTEVKDLIIINYEDTKDLDSYKQNIINKLDYYDNTITFAIIIEQCASNEEATEKISNVQSIISDNIDLLQGTAYKTALTSGKPNIPNNMDYTMLVTFITN